MKLGINGLALIQILFLLIAPNQSFGQKLMGDYHQIMTAAFQHFGNNFFQINLSCSFMRKKIKKKIIKKKKYQCVRWEGLLIYYNK
jgi:hypothetical protein